MSTEPFIEPRLTPCYWPELDGLRALAFFLVFAHHVEMTPSPTGNLSRLAVAFYQTISAWGWSGVDLFFVLSSFLITSLLMRERALTGQVSFALFFLRRTLRIWPLYFFFIILTAFLIAPLAMFPTDQSHLGMLLSNFVYFSFFLGNFGVMLLPSSMIIGVFHPLWSLCVEEQFYVAWGLLFSKLRNTLYLFPIIGVLLVSTIVCRWATYETMHDYKYFYLNTFARLDPILGGALSAMLWLRYSSVISKIGGVLFVVATVLLSMVFFFAPPIKDNASSMVWVLSCLAISYSCLLLATLSWKPAKTFFSSPVMITMGRLTYGMYIYHSLAFVLCNRYFLCNNDASVQFWGHWCISLPMTYLLSFASWHLLEKRFCLLKGRFTVVPSGHLVTSARTVPSSRRL